MSLTFIISFISFTAFFAERSSVRTRCTGQSRVERLRLARDNYQLLIDNPPGTCFHHQRRGRCLTQLCWGSGPALGWLSWDRVYYICITTRTSFVYVYIFSWYVYCCNIVVYGKPYAVWRGS